MPDALLVTTITIVILIIATTVALIVSKPAHGQFSSMPTISGESYTAEDIQNGAADHLNDKWQSAITSGSMLPDYKIGQYVTVDMSIPFESLEVGDVIVFAVMDEAGREILQADSSIPIPVEGTDYLLMHRIIDIEDFEDGSRVIKAKGDANEDTLEHIEDYITIDAYVGKIIESESFEMEQQQQQVVTVRGGDLVY